MKPRINSTTQSRRLFRLLGLFPLIAKCLLIHLARRLPNLALLLGRLDADHGIRLALLGRAPNLLFRLFPRRSVAIDLVSMNC